MKPKNLLLATDLSCRCDRALDRAALLAAEWQSRLTVLHALQNPAPGSDLPSWRRPPDPAHTVRRELSHALQGKPAIELDVLVEQGEPAKLILEAIGRLGCDLVLTGVARNELLGRSSLGATVETLARRASVPVLVVKSRPRGPYRNVVVATDFSPFSRYALETALTLLPAAQVSLFHAFDIPYASMVGDRLALREAMAREAQAKCRDFLATTPAAATASGPILTHCDYGDPCELLQDLVQVREIDLVVLGTEGRTGLAHALLGSVAQRLLACLPVDVLLVRRQRD